MFFISFSTGKDLFPWSILCFRSHFTYICNIFNNCAVNALPFLLTSTLADEHIATPEMGLPCCNCLIRESSLTSEQTFYLQSWNVWILLFSVPHVWHQMSHVLCYAGQSDSWRKRVTPACFMALAETRVSLDASVFTKASLLLLHKRHF